MNLTDISALKGKVANGGATSQGILTSENWNTLVSAVDELQGASIVAVTPSANPTSSSVNVILQFQTGKGNPVQCQLVIPASSEASAGVFTPAQLNSLKLQIQAVQKTANANTTSIDSLKGTLDSTTKATNASARLVIPVFCNNSITFETEEAFRERGMAEEGYQILKNVEYAAKKYIAWHLKTGETINIDTLALLIVSSDGTPSVVTEELTDEFRELPQLYERVTTVENNKYVYKLYAIVDSSNTDWDVNKTVLPKTLTPKLLAKRL